MRRGEGAPSRAGTTRSRRPGRAPRPVPSMSCKAILKRGPPGIRPAIEELCVEDRACLPGRIDDVREVLDLVAAELGLTRRRGGVRQERRESAPPARHRGAPGHQDRAAPGTATLQSRAAAPSAHVGTAWPLSRRWRASYRRWTRMLLRQRSTHFSALKDRHKLRTEKGFPE